MSISTISVIVPVLNEYENITPLLDEINNALCLFGKFEVIYVDDGSEDGTTELLSNLSLERSYLRVVSHEVPCGQSRAIHSGVLAAKADWIVTLDGDGQNDPADIVKLWRALQQYPDSSRNQQVFVGHRHQRADTWVKRLSSKVANAVRRRILHDNTPDTGCGIKLFLREGFLALPYFDHMHRFLPALFIRQGFEVASVHVNHRNRQAGYSHYGMLDRLLVGIPDLLGVLWLIKRQKLPTLKK